MYIDNGGTYQEYRVIKFCLCSSDRADTEGEGTHRRCKTVMENPLRWKCLPKEPEELRHSTDLPLKCEEIKSYWPFSYKIR